VLPLKDVYLERLSCWSESDVRSFDLLSVELAGTPHFTHKSEVR
jgi:hypothetical protein